MQITTAFGAAKLQHLSVYHGTCQLQATTSLALRTAQVLPAIVADYDPLSFLLKICVNIFVSYLKCRPVDMDHISSKRTSCNNTRPLLRRFINSSPHGQYPSLQFIALSNSSSQRFGFVIFGQMIYHRSATQSTCGVYSPPSLH